MALIMVIESLLGLIARVALVLVWCECLGLVARQCNQVVGWF